MAKYKKRKDGRYSTSVFIGYDDQGKKKNKVLYGRTIRELDEKVSEFKAFMKKGVIPNNVLPSLGEWAEQWLETYKKPLEYNTYSMYENAVTRLKPLFNIKLNALKKTHFQLLINEIIDAGHIRTAQILLMTIEQIIHCAMDEQYIFADCSRGLTVPRNKSKEKRPLTADELKLIDNAQLDIKERAFISLLLYCGLRRGEALALSAADVDFKHGKLSVSKNLVFQVNTPVIKNSPKTESGNRDLPVPDRLLSDLKILSLSTVGAPCLFPMDTKPEYMSHSSFNRFWKGIMKRTELPDDVTPHILRHTYASKLIASGADVKTVQYLLGHATAQMTLDVYTHMSRDFAELKDIVSDAFAI